MKDIKEILIVNLTRMGDLLQTTPLMAGFKKKYPDSRITLLVNSAFAGICKRIPFFDDLIEFDMRGYGNRLHDGRYSLVNNFRYLERLVERINEKEYDLALNLTHSPISAVLISLVRAKEVRGFTMDSHGNRVIKHPWMRYFFNVVPNRKYNPFHLVDMYLKVADVLPGTEGLILNVLDEDSRQADALLKKENITESRVLIGLHLGASKSDKTWPVSSYAELAGMICDEYSAGILLFGTESESDLAEEFMKSISVPCVNFVGRTSIAELAALLKRCSLFISNDTGPLHIAASVGTKVIDISVANVHFMETGPYGTGHYVIQADLPCVPCGFDVECNNMVCKSLVKPGAVLEVVKVALGKAGNILNADPSSWDSITVYKSYFKEDGYLDFLPLVRPSLKKEIFYRILYRYSWHLKQDFVNGRVNEALEKLYGEINSFYSLDRFSSIIPSIREETNILERLVQLAEEGIDLTGRISREAARENMDIRKIKKIGERIEAVDHEIKLIGHANPSFRPYLVIFEYTKEALEENELRVLAENSGRIYGDLKKNTSGMLQLMKKIMPLLETKTELKTRELIKR